MSHRTIFSIGIGLGITLIVFGGMVLKNKQTLPSPTSLPVQGGKVSTSTPIPSSTPTVEPDPTQTPQQTIDPTSSPAILNPEPTPQSSAAGSQIPSIPSGQAPTPTSEPAPTPTPTSEPTPSSPVTPNPAPTPAPPSPAPTSTPKPRMHIVLMEPGRFNPSTTNIKNGDTVKWINRDTDVRWPASDPHPLHTNFPGFDSLGNVEVGDSYAYTFTQAKVITYHDHINANIIGTVVVED